MLARLPNAASRLTLTSKLPNKAERATLAVKYMA